MVGKIFFVKIPYSDFSYIKARPILIIKALENDFLFVPLTSNLERSGIVIGNHDLSSGHLKKESVVIVPKISAIDKRLGYKNRLIATLKSKKFQEVYSGICKSMECEQHERL